MDHGHGQAVPWPRESGPSLALLHEADVPLDASGGASAGLSPRGRMKERWNWLEHHLYSVYSHYGFYI